MTDNEDERLSKREPLSVARRNREADDRTTTENRGLEDREATEKREISDDERLEMFRMQLFNDVLPDIPPIKGYHICWLTTTNPRDSIQKRMRLGYEPVKPDDVPGAGLEYATLKTGEHAGLIGVNEMVAFKLPDSLYQMYMAEAHYHDPLRQEEGIVSMLDGYQEQADRDGGKIIEDEGFRAMREAAPRLTAFR